MNNAQNSLIKSGYCLPIMEQFYTIQGEGFHTGKAAYFIRIGGCDVGCHWCDVKESWDSERHPVIPIEGVVKRAKDTSKTVVITGGEPLTWNMEPLTKSLKSQDMMIHLETSGAYLLSGYWDWICLSPKKLKPVKYNIYNQSHELKVIIYNKSDFEFAEEHASRVSENCLLYLQPEWSHSEEMMSRIIDYVMQNPKWQVSLQTHKFLNIP